VAAGLLSDDQRAAIAAYEHGLRVEAPAPPSGTTRAARVPALAEAFGYLGGMLATSGLALIVVNAWPDLSTTGRLLVSGGAAAGLLAGGALAREHVDPALTRLRGFLWLAGSAAAGLFTGVLAADAAELGDVTVVLSVAVMVAVLGGFLWRGHDRPLQQLSLLAGAVVAAGALVAELASRGPVGLVVLGVGAGYIAIGLRRMAVGPLLFEGCGGLAMVVGAGMVASQWESAGFLLLVATAMALLAIASVPRLALERAERVVVGLLGSITMLQSAPSAIGWFSQDAGVATGLVTAAVGGAVLALGVRGATRAPLATELLGGLALLIGAAVTATQVSGMGPILGIVAAVGLVALGTRRGEAPVSVLGSAGLLANVPWAISHFFPGEGQVPLAIVVTGALLVAIAVRLARSSGRPDGRPGPQAPLTA
jgi:hypothetical protein